jgi:hypothetical protein
MVGASRKKTSDGVFAAAPSGSAAKLLESRKYKYLAPTSRTTH